MFVVVGRSVRAELVRVPQEKPIAMVSAEICKPITITVVLVETPVAAEEPVKVGNASVRLEKPIATVNAKIYKQITTSGSEPPQGGGVG